MATITFKYVSTRDFAPYYVRLEHKGKRYNAPTKLLVDRSFYNNHYKPFLKLSVKQLQAKKNDANIDKCIEHQEILEPLQIKIHTIANHNGHQMVKNSCLLQNITKEYTF